MRGTILVICAMLLCAGVTTEGQDKSKTISLKGVERIGVVFDYSEITIEGYTLDTWLEIRQAEQPEYNALDEWENELKPAVRGKVIKYVNEKIMKKGAHLVEADDTDYVLTVKPTTVKKKGNNFCRVILSNKDGSETMEFEVNGSGGMIGTMANLWGDGFENTGNSIGRRLKKLFK